MLSGSLCIQLATSLHTYVSDVMLAAPADAEGSTHSSILQVTEHSERARAALGVHGFG